MAEFQHLYDTGYWKRRRKLQLLHHPLCAFCAQSGMVTRATVADHVRPHKGDRTLFMLGQLQSLCAPCHNSRKQIIEERGHDIMVDDHGWPTDPRHPANRHRS